MSPKTILRRNFSGEKIPTQMQMTKKTHFSNRKWKSTSHVVIVEIKNLKIEEIRELRRKSTIEDIVGEVKVTKRNER
jgi:ribosomal protein L10